MKLGYPGINYGLGCTSSHTLRLASLNDEKLLAVAARNIECLRHMLVWNVEHGLLFFRVSSSIIPLASHQSMRTDWQTAFKDDLASIGMFIKENNMRISMHPGQFVIINSSSEQTYKNSVAELVYHAELMDMMGLDSSHKFQIHIGGIYGDSDASFKLFIERYHSLPAAVRQRMVIENDERAATVQDLVKIHEGTGIPILFDTLHHVVNNNAESLIKGLDAALKTWGASDGLPMIDYSTQDPYKKVGAHAVTLDVDHFRRFLKSLKHRDIDIMFEIKNKEASALQAKVILDNLERHNSF